ncbi:unnamed protein product, partial [Effrenium voratum]
IPPCQPCYGKMDSSGDERVESTARHVELWLDQLSKPEHKLLIRKVRVTWSAETFYSPERELAWEAWITLSSTTRVPNKASSFKHVLGNSPLLKRGAFPVFINAMARKDFRNWKVPLSFHGAGGSNNALSIEQLQWFSGSELHSQFLRHLGLQLGEAENVILENVTTSLSNMYKEKLRQKTLLLETGVVIPEVGQGAEKLNGISITDSSSQGIQWSSLQKAHNDKFPSGAAYSPASNKRGPECSTEELQKQTKPAMDLKPAQPPDGLLSTGVATDDFQLILAPDGSLYVKALKDSCLESSAALFLCKGTYKTGATAKAEKGKPGSAFIPSEMSQDTLVVVDVGGARCPNGAPPSFPVPLEAALQWFAGARLQVGAIFKDKVFEVEGKFKVAATDDVIYQLDVSRKDMDPKAVIAKEALSSYVDYSKLTHLQAIQR